MNQELIIAVGTVLGTIATVSGAWLQWRSYKRKKSVTREILVSEKLKIYLTRQRAVFMDEKLVRRAERGDEIFGSCIDCTFPKELITTGIIAIVEKGVNFKLLVYSGPGGTRFGKLIARSGVRNCEVKVFHEPKPIRLLGIKDKEIMIVLGETFKPEKYYTIHFLDSTITQFFYEVFQSLWQRSQSFDSYLESIESQHRSKGVED